MNWVIAIIAIAVVVIWAGENITKIIQEMIRK